MVRPSPKPFPVPVVSFEAANGLATEDAPDYLVMPSDMATFQPPVLPEREALAGHGATLRILREVCAALRAAGRGEAVPAVPVVGLSAADLRLLNQVLGEGEVSAQVLASSGRTGLVRVQEAVFAGVWRVLRHSVDGSLADCIEVGAIPEVLREAARDDGRRGPGAPPPLPEGIVNVPTLLGELAEHRQHWRPGQPAEVVNLSLLPLAPEDIGVIDEQLGTGRVVILSRGYGNCRITDTLQPNTWRVVYYNSQDKVILNAVEVGALPEVACAAPEDLADSLERLSDVLDWVETP